MLKLPEINQPHIYLFGVGGTGGFALDYLTRLYANNENPVTIEVYDGDVVESKNLKRQNFTLDDLDLKKSTALIKHLSKQLQNPPKLIDHDEYIVDADQLTSDVLLNTENNETAIFVLAVDNIATRRLINQVIHELSGVLNIIAIDSGNDNQGGQIVLYANTSVSDINMTGRAHNITLPSMLELFPNIDKIVDARDENPGLVSYCAEESESKRQSMKRILNILANTQLILVFANFILEPTNLFETLNTR